MGIASTFFAARRILVLSRGLVAARRLLAPLGSVEISGWRWLRLTLKTHGRLMEDSLTM
jgi:hypothetical protein